MAGDPQTTIGTRTLRGVAWAYGSYAGGRLLVLVTTAVLAHLLTPGDFGLVAIALAVIAILDRLADLGLTQALVVGPIETLERRAETVFVAAIAISVTLAAALMAAHGAVAGFFGEPDVGPLVIVLAATMPLRALGGTHYAIAQRRLDFRSRTVAEISEVVVRAAVGIPLAVAGAGAWSLVAGFLAGTAALTAVIWLRVSWRPRLRPQRADLPGLAGFGAKLSALDVIATAISQVDYLIAGRVLGPAALGLYTLAFRLPELLIVNLSLVAGTVLYAGYASLPRTELERAFLVSLRYTLLIALPIAAGVAILAEPLVLTLFGDSWEAATPTMRVLAAASLVLAIGVPGGTVLKADGRAGFLVWLALARLAALTGALIAFADRGIEAVALCVLAVALTGELVALAVAARRIGAGPARIASTLPAPAAATLLASLPMLAAALLLGEPVVALLSGTAGGVVAYLAAVRVLAPDELSYALSRLRGSAPAAGSAPAP